MFCNGYDRTDVEHKIDKHIKGKVDLSLLPPMPLIEIAKAYMFGERVYGRWKWADGISYSKLFAAALRHSWRWFWGQEINPESNVHHLAHAAWYMLTLIQYSMGKHYNKFDDRPLKAAGMLDVSISEELEYEVPEIFIRSMEK